MSRLLLIAATILLLTAAPALAYCPSYPDTGATAYVENNTARAVCLQHELGRRTDDMAVEAEIDAMLGTIELELQRQRQLMLTAPQVPYIWP